MSMRVPDLQVVVSRTQEVGRIQQSQQMNESAQQQSFAEGLIKQAAIESQTVQMLPEAEQSKIDGDRSNREKGDSPSENDDRQQSDKESSEKSAEAEKLVHPFVGSIIDCKV